MSGCDIIRDDFQKPPPSDKAPVALERQTEGKDLNEQPKSVDHTPSHLLSS